MNTKNFPKLIFIAFFGHFFRKKAKIVYNGVFGDVFSRLAPENCVFFCLGPPYSSPGIYNSVYLLVTSIDPIFDYGYIFFEYSKHHLADHSYYHFVGHIRLSVFLSQYIYIFSNMNGICSSVLTLFYLGLLFWTFYLGGVIFALPIKSMLQSSNDRFKTFCRSQENQTFI